jgi:hypothetical protein
VVKQLADKAMLERQRWAQATAAATTETLNPLAIFPWSALVFVRFVHIIRKTLTRRS